MDHLPQSAPTNTAPRKACDGRCQESCKKRVVTRCLVLAACSGVIGVLQKDDAVLSPWPPMEKDDYVYGSLQAFSDAMREATARQAFQQLIIVGSKSDMAWLRASLPEEAQSRLVAEIQYPLLPEWLKEPRLQPLITAITPLIQ